MSKTKEPCTINLQPTEIRKGDTGYARTTGFLGFLIRVGEKLKWRNGLFNHALTVINEGETYEEIKIVQATLRGVIISSLSEMMDSSINIEILPAHQSWDRHKIAEFAKEQVGSAYGLMSIFCIGLDILTPDWFVAFRRNGTWICSALAEEANRYGGMLKSWKDIYTVTPTLGYIEHKKALAE